MDLFLSSHFFCFTPNLLIWGLSGSFVFCQKFPHPSSPAGLSKAGWVVEWGMRVT